ncbi:MAG: hypothetical protein EBQ92_04485 [Proteobacteria bacterium]|nr:hypothetical protein [Pseudomonadota bacterium]
MSLGLGCGDDELPGLIPMTQKSVCIRRWDKEQIVVISERDCVFCRELLVRMRKEMSVLDQKKVEVLWIESSPAACLENAQRFPEFGIAKCISRRVVADKWGINSTPIVFWVQDEKRMLKKGLFASQQKLPWISSPSSNRLK